MNGQLHSFAFGGKKIWKAVQVSPCRSGLRNGIDELRMNSQPIDSKDSVGRSIL